MGIIASIYKLIIFITKIEIKKIGDFKASLISMKYA